MAHSSDVGLEAREASDLIRPSRPASIDELPDLTNRIMSMGLFEEYQKFRQGALAVSLAADPEHGRRAGRTMLESFYPTYGSWKWQRTASYWIAVTFLEGSLLFVMGNGFAWAGASGWRIRHDERREKRVEHALTAWPALFGAAFFSAGAYLMCLETMNVMRATDQWRFWPFAIRDTLAHLDSIAGESGEITRIPYLASMAYFVGTCVYPIALVSALFAPLGKLSTLLLSSVPFTVGGLLFAIGGLLECIESRVFRSLPRDLSWWVAALNFSGGLLFFAGGAVLFWPESDLASDILFTVGSLLYTIGSVFMVVMWKEEQYGMAFMAALNQFAYQDQEQGTSFSVSGIVFVSLYCLVSVFAVLNFCVSLVVFIEKPSLFNVTRCANEILPFLLLHLVLLLHSAVVKTPKLQPFHAIIMSIRILSFVIGVTAVTSFAVAISPERKEPVMLGPLPPYLAFGSAAEK